MTKRILLYFVIGGLLMAAGSGFAKKTYKKTDLRKETIQRELTSEKSMVVKMDLSMVDLSIAKVTDNLAYKADLLYDADRFSPLISYNVRGDRGFLDLSADVDEFDDFDDIGDLFKGGDFGEDGDHPNSWDLYLTDRIPLDITTELAMASGDLDLSGLQIVDLRMEAGMASMKVKFDEPNPVTMDRMAIEVGLGDMEMENIGNASAKKLDVEVGLGSATIDFGGKVPRDFRAEMEVGLGSLTIVIPKDVQAKIHCECSFLSSVDFEGFKQIDDDLYVSKGFDSDEDYITIKLSVGMGSVEVKR
jgi:hypothetical protein